MHRFYVPLEVLAPALRMPEPEGEVALPADTVQQLSRVLRLRPGDRIVLFSGDGREHSAVLDTLTPRSGLARLTETTTPDVELACELHVAVATLKGEKLDWTLQKLTELGAARISLLETERTIRHAGEDRWPRRLERYSRIIVEAAEQSGRVRVPSVAGPVSLEEVLNPDSSAAARYLLDPRAGIHLFSTLQPCRPSVLLLIGPEGGFSPAEEQRAERLGAVRVSLGRRTLRAETAAIAAATVVATASETG